MRDREKLHTLEWFASLQAIENARIRRLPKEPPPREKREPPGWPWQLAFLFSLLLYIYGIFVATRSY